MSYDFRTAVAAVRGLSKLKISGRISSLGEAIVEVDGLARYMRIGDRVQLLNSAGRKVCAEAVSLKNGKATVLPEARLDGFSLDDEAVYIGQSSVRPDVTWVGHVLDAFGQRVDGGPLAQGSRPYELRAAPPSALFRKPLGARLETGLAVFNTFLPIVQGQRIGIFSGSGVGKTTLLGKLVRTVAADVVVLVLIGERGREVREFVEQIIGAEAMRRCVVVAATSDQAPSIKRRAAFVGMAIAEMIRDEGAQVLFLADSITRFAEAHRDVAAASGERPSITGFPTSTTKLIMELAERAGTGPNDAGDITAIFSVLVAGSDFEEPIADMLRGVLDGHVILDREIASRGRFPAIDVLNSVSRSLPGAATQGENELLAKARKLLADYDQSKLMIETGLYTKGSNPDTDRAQVAFRGLEAFLGRVETQSIEESFLRLKTVVD